MNKDDYITIANKLMTIADSGIGDVKMPSIRAWYFNREERQLLKKLIIKCNENRIYDEGEIENELDRKIQTEKIDRY